MVTVKTIKQTITFSAPPQQIYNLLMNGAKHAAFTGEKASISSVIGGRSTAYDGYSMAKNIALVPGKKIVQTWRASDWPKNCHSTVTFVFTPHAGGTKLLFTHADVPIKFVKNIAAGWKEFYWKRMKQYLKNSG